MTAHPATGECVGCGTWVCSGCGWSRVRAARWSAQHCPRCHSTKGVMEPTHHLLERVTQDHAEAWARGLADGMRKLY